MRGNWVGAVVGIGLLGWVVGGCSGPTDAGGGVSPSTARASSPSATVSAPAPTTSVTTRMTPTTTPTQVILPPAATAHTEDGAKAFVRIYFEVLSLAGTNTETGPIRALSSNDCAGCRRIFGAIDTLHDQGKRYNIASIVVLGTVLKPGSTTSRPVVLMQGKELPSKLIASDGSAIESFAGGPLLFEATLVWTDAGWRMRDMVTR